MSLQIIQNLDYLKRINEAKNKRALLRKATASEISAITELLSNLLKNNISTLTKTDIQKLRKFKKELRAINRYRNNRKKIKQLLIEKGGAILSALAIALPALISLITKQ